MVAMYTLIENGKTTSLLYRNASGFDMPWILTKALAIAFENGGNFAEAMAEIQDDRPYIKSPPPYAKVFERVHPAEAEILKAGFPAEHILGQHIKIDLDNKKMVFAHDPSICKHGMQDGVKTIPDITLEGLKMARQKCVIRVKDLLLIGLNQPNIYLVHEHADVGFIPAGHLSELVDKDTFTELLNAKVQSIKPGAYGVHLVLSGVSPEMMVQYDQALSNGEGHSLNSTEVELGLEKFNELCDEQFQTAFSTAIKCNFPQKLEDFVKLPSTEMTEQWIRFTANNACTNGPDDTSYKEYFENILREFEDVRTDFGVEVAQEIYDTGGINTMDVYATGENIHLIGLLFPEQEEENASPQMQWE